MEQLAWIVGWSAMAGAALILGPRQFANSMVAGTLLMLAMCIYALAFPVLLVRDAVMGSVRINRR